MGCSVVPGPTDGENDGPPLAQEARSLDQPHLELGVLNKSLTVVLPVYNSESRLRKSVHEILELASELTSRFGVLIIDDGSNDATYEIAEELAARYPQVSVRRHRHRRGLGSMIEYAQRQVSSDAVIVHDGTTPIDAGEMRNLWRRWIHQTSAQQDRPAAGMMRDEIRELAKLPAVHAWMEKAHNRVIGFQLLTPASTGNSVAGEAATGAQASRSGTSHVAPQRGVGQIPPLPWPKFVSAVAKFAFGE
jgi:hypothetical protein